MLATLHLFITMSTLYPSQGLHYDENQEEMPSSKDRRQPSKPPRKGSMTRGVTIQTYNLQPGFKPMPITLFRTLFFLLSNQFCLPFLSLKIKNQLLSIPSLLWKLHLDLYLLIICFICAEVNDTMKSLIKLQ